MMEKREKMYQAGLILEGGGMKGVYTAGVLDFFLEKGILFSSVYGVSAGACHMCSYLSGQKRRGLDITLDYLDTGKYCSLRSLLTTGDLFNVDMCYHLIPEYLNPYDYKAFEKYQGKAYSVVTNIVTGKPEYLRIRDMKADMDKIRASASLPLVSRNVKIGNRIYLDGGLSDSIPLARSILDGNTRNVVVMTKEEGYVRKPSRSLLWLKLRYLRYPMLHELMKNRHQEYQETLSYIEEQKERGRAFVIRPKKASKVGRIEKDVKKLKTLYQEGYENARSRYEEMWQYLETREA
jgi:predicted patatin/cPLA2 family phospholipase